MKAKSKIFVVLSAIAIIATNLLLPVTFSSCDRGDDCVHQYITDTLWIPPEDTVQIILNGYERLRYQVTIDSQIVDTVEFKGQGIFTTFTKFVDQGICEDYTHYEEHQTFLYKNTGPDYNWGNLEFRLYLENNSSTFFEVELRKVAIRDIVGRIDWIDYQGYYEEMNLNGINYSNVNMFLSKENSEKKGKLYYVKREGIVRVEIGNREIWDLIP
jgi:hypothetical protein